ncbi:fluoride efflux transporter CrcB [Saccharopolyspora hordei]|uniref:Fluoride-specific ion channel FluC n=1 Tax=Saccharopolyspora hordei TaxID=1838 RepID=A0A853AID3_9PSEU|nr:CrcB protein [Saccharopolyspora hordei]
MNTEPAKIDQRVAPQRSERVRSQAPVLAAISIGGGLGALARYGIAQLAPSVPGHFPWGTFWTNVLGCFLIGILMVLITEVWSAHRLLRPFLGVGFLGGFTTFSTYAVETHALLRPGSVGTAFGYLAGTMVGALVAVVLGVWLTRWVTRRRGGAR